MRSSGVALAGGAVASGCKSAGTPEVKAASEAPAKATDKPAIQTYRTLGRTGFEVSDVSLGCGMIADPNVLRYAYDRGVNFFDTAESYGNGDSETKIGQAMPHLDRKKIFIVTKLQIKEEDEEASILDRFGKCLERMKTEYADALYIHSVTDVKMVTHPAFHAAAAKLKADGRIKHVGISNHGPRDEGQDSMEKVLGSAVEDGRFDVMLIAHNVLKQDEGKRVLAACKAKNVGTTGMKSSPAVLEIPPFDPDNPTGEYKKYMDRMAAAGTPREQAVARLQKWNARREESIGQIRPWAQEQGLKTNDELRVKSIQWVLGQPDMHTVCVSMGDFDLMDKFIPLSGTKLAGRQRRAFERYAAALSPHYCRHACGECLGRCPESLPVSTIMRYAYYFDAQRREKHAMGKYAGLGGRNASACYACSAPCEGACPFGVDIQANLVRAHGLLSFA